MLGWGREEQTCPDCLCWRSCSVSLCHSLLLCQTVILTRVTACNTLRRQARMPARKTQPSRLLTKGVLVPGSLPLLYAEVCCA